ncbi:MFS transporter [Streptomyces sannanensis]|uniref:MFS transporter n=1 Tax=Streptomyces sannanensis TaxID=285536 RepID=A0ABP6S583_9ACTN
MPSDTSSPTTHPTTSYRALLRNREFAGLYASFTLTVAASTLSGFALGTLVNHQTGSPFLTAVSMYGATFATVLGALTLMSVADGSRPRRTLVALQCVSLVGVAAQAIPGLPLAARFGLLLVLGFFQSLGTGTRMGLLAEVVPTSAYALARSLMNITSGGMAILGYAIGAMLLRYVNPQEVFIIAAALTGLGLVVVATTIREHSIRLTRRPGLRQTWTTNVALFSHSGQRALLLNLWVPNGLIVGCEALFISYAPDHAGALLAAGSAGILLGDLTVGRLLTADQRRRYAFALRLLLAVPYLLFAVHPPMLVVTAAVFIASAGFAATLPLQEQLLALTPDPVRGQVQGVESAGRMTWQGIGAAIAGGVAQHLTPGAAVTALAAVSIAITVGSRPFVVRARSVSVEKTST